MRSLYHDVVRLSAEVEENLKIEYKSLDDLLSESDFVTLHIPHNEKTDKVIGKREFALMKQSAFLVNTARGGLLDENALYHALKNNRIAGAGLDVFEYEPLAKDSPLLRLSNIIFTPHMAAGPKTIDITEVCRNIQRVAKEATRA
jgi:phosphoglycerate dehydrogenase-like enzyme